MHRLTAPFRSLAGVAAVALGALAAAPASAALLTTTYAGGNGARGIVFDIQVFNPLTITAIDVNLISGATLPVSLYVRSGSSAGFQATATGWNLVGSQNVTSAGGGLATFVDLPDLSLAAGIFGLYVGTPGNIAGVVNYTDGTTSYANADLSISAGAGTFGSPGAAVAGTPRVFNGGIHYTLQAVPEPGALALVAAALGAMALVRRRRA